MNAKPLLWVAIAVLLGQGMVALAATQEVRPDKLRTSYDSTRGLLTIWANDASLAEVLRRLDREHGIVLTIQPFEDRRVTVDIRNEPLPQALGHLLPANTRYRLNLRGGDVELKPDQQDAKKRRDEPTTRPSGLPTKDRTGGGDRSRTKPERGGDGAPRTIEGGKRLPGEGQVPSTGKPETTSRPTGSYFRLRLHVTQTSVRIERVLQVAGRLERDPRMRGSFVYSVSVDGAVKYVGSVPDPLEVHSHQPESQDHSVERASSGFALLSIPGELFDETKLRTMEVRCFLVTRDTGLPKELTVENFSRFQESATPVGTLQSREIMEAYRQRR